ncbi:Aste57867_1169 [Aphanomyces stellatus]|uniref:Aste57867_1169 protein n=1 Tax=Aphanomyces stellatus TaxID=120398 RepID=A0A485K5S4_9STRA|nr:hypothetical protein As57867_001168 [Aphanomyces stellatus]VFT78389.1 Aste57867_1169 [Aphanomyces stellatus]
MSNESFSMLVDETDVSSDVSEVLAAVDTVLARRRYQREKQRQHRRKAKDERAILLEELATLQAKLPVLTTGETTTPEGMLSWRVIADVFRATSGRAKDQKHHLFEETRKYMAVTHELQRFLRACRPMMPRPALPSSDVVVGNHSFVTLLASAESRSRAKQWLTQQLYHNTDRAFASFPSTAVDGGDFTHCKYRFKDSELHGTDMYQAVFNAPLKVVLAAQQRKLLRKRWLDLGELDIESEGNTAVYRNLDLQAMDYWNILEGVFYEADRCVVVYRRLQDDETYSSRGCYEHHAMQWIDMRQLKPNQTIVRFMGVRTVMRPKADRQDMAVSDDPPEPPTSPSPSERAQGNEVARVLQGDIDEMRHVVSELLTEGGCNI